MPVSPWEEDQGSGEQSLIESDEAPLQEVMLRFGLTLPTARGAQAFVRLFGFTYTRSAVTVRDNVAWLSFSCAATDARDAALQAAVAVRTITEHKRLLSGEHPIASHFYDTQVGGPVRATDLVRARAERAEALAKARAWGLLHDPLVQGADKTLSSNAADQASPPREVAAPPRKRLSAPPRGRDRS
jgi:hypothetical protein